MLIVAPVKQVISGDTLVVVGNKGATLRVTLTGLKAPRFPQQPKAAAVSTSTGNTVDEVFGVEAREFVRPLVVGKKVAFKIDQKHPTNADQCWATVWIGTQEGPMDATLNAQVAKEGWARLKEADFAKQKDGELEKLLTKLCTEAEQAARGVYQSASLAKRIIWDVADDFELFAETLKKQKTTRAVIEYCRDGSTFRVLLLDSKIMLWFSLAGVMGARKPAEKDATGASTAPQEDPLAAEAKRFTEVRLLQREVTLEVGGYDTTSRIFYGAVKHPNGIIAEELLKVGLAKLIDWSISFLTQKEDANKFRALQKDAQEKRLGMWKDYVSKSVASGDLKDYEGVIAEVLSGDTIIVRIGTNPEQLREQPWTCEEKRVSLSSIQAPRLGPRNTEAASDEKYASEAREFLRSKFSGAKVKVHIDYSRQPKAQPGSEGSTPPPVRNFATVTTVNKPNVNLAIEIVRQGLAEVVAHRADDDRSPEYDGLLAAQQEAKQGKRGLFSTQEAVKYRRLHLQNDATKAKNFLPHLQREKDAKHRCVVEWCSSGSKLGLDIPEQNCVLSFGLAGIVCPSLAKKSVKDSVDEPFAKEALAFTRSCCLHANNVKCKIETMDRVGTFLGSLLVPFKNDSEQNLAILLLERGLAKVQPFSADQTKYRQSLYDAEKRAKNARLGVWRDWSEEQERAELGEVEEEAQDEDESAPLKFTPCVVTDVADGETIYVRWKTSKVMEDRQRVEQDMERVLQATSLPPSQVKRGQMVCAAFDDGSGLKYYRGRIEFVNAQQQTARVKFIDYGNEDIVPLNKIRPQSQQTASIPPLASERKLAFVKSRLLNEEYGRDAAMALSELVFSGSPDLVGCDTKFGVVLTLAGTEHEEDDEEAVPTINRDLIAQGLAFVRTKDGRKIKQKALQRVFYSMQEAEDNAHRKHLNLWRFGDPRQDEED